MARKPFSPSEIDSRSIVGNNPYSRFAIIVLSIACLLAIAFILSGFGSRWGWWHFSTGFAIMRWTAYAGIAMTLISAIAIYRVKQMRSRRGTFMAVIAMVVSILLFIIPFSVQQFARSFPPIHDITTDTQDPPEFVEVIPLREDAPNPPEYEGGEVTEMQEEAYPDLSSLSLNMPFDEAFDIALQAANNMRGWEIVDYSRDDGRIEATDQTFWYGFKDDVVIRVRDDNDFAIIDVRSKSRVGRGDLGVNARRIERYLDQVGGLQ